MRSDDDSGKNRDLGTSLPPAFLKIEILPAQEQKLFRPEHIRVRNPYSQRDAATQSKTALNAETHVLASALKKTNIEANCVSPGWVKTRMGVANTPDTPQQGVQAILWLATAEAPPAGGFFLPDLGSTSPEWNGGNRPPALLSRK